MALNFAVAPAVAGTNPPPIPKAQAWADVYGSIELAATHPVLDLSQGVPRDAPHPSVLAALAETSSDPGSARYGPILGEPALREAVAEEIRVQYSLPSPSRPIEGKVNGEHDSRSGVTAANVGITTGCNMAFLTLLMALCPPGSSVLLPLPAYFNNSMCLSLQSVKPVYVPSDPSHSFLPNISAARFQLKSHAGKQVEGVRMIVLVSPNNPTGSVMPPDVIRQWYDLAKEFGVALVLDETYRDFVEDGAGGRGKPHGLFELKDWDRTLICLGSFSKGYRIPGHRLGNIIASPALLKHVTTICDCMQICAPRPPQLALAPLLPTLRSDLVSASAALSSRRRLFQATVNAVPGWNVDASGGFFAYVSYPDAYATAGSVMGKKRKLESEDVARELAQRFGVITLPGAFFMPNLGEDWEGVKDNEKLREDRWLRFAVANVDDGVIRQLGPRLKRMNDMMGMTEEQSDV